MRNSKIWAAFGAAVTGLATLALAVSAASRAHAADLSALKAPPAPVYQPVFTWNGFYGGLQAGYGFNDTDNATWNVDPSLTGTATTISGEANPNAQGAVFGGHLGYNIMFGHFMVGLEGFGDGTLIKGSTTPLSIVAPGTRASVSFADKLTWAAGGFGRIGFAPWNDILFSGKVGGACGAVEEGFTAVGLGTPAPTGGASSTKCGLAWGGTLEYALGTSGWSIRVDYTQLNLGTDTFLVTVPGRGVNAAAVKLLDVSQQHNYGLWTIGATYHFNSFGG